MGMLVAARESVAQHVAATHYVWAQLASTVPTDAAAGTPVGARVQVAVTAGGSDGQVALAFTFASVPVGTYRGVDYYTAQSGGTRSGWYAFAAEVTLAEVRHIEVSHPFTVGNS